MEPTILLIGAGLVLFGLMGGQSGDSGDAAGSGDARAGSQNQPPANANPGNLPFQSVNPGNKGIGVGIDFGSVPEYPGGYHPGIDQHAPDKPDGDLGGAPVVAPYEATVVFAGHRSDHYGNAIILDHGMLRGKRILTQIGHLRKIIASVGDTVTKGQTIAVQGGLPNEPGAGRSSGLHTHTDTIHYTGPAGGDLTDPAHHRREDPIEWYDLPEPVYFQGAKMRKGRSDDWVRG